MANVEPFNYKIDKITERETVYDFVSRLSIGKDFYNEDYSYDAVTNQDSKRHIFPAGAKLKEDILMNIIRTMDVVDIQHLDTIKTLYATVKAGEMAVTITPYGPYSSLKLYRIIQQSTGHDVTKCFTKSNAGSYTATFDVPTSHSDVYKAYFYEE